MKDEKLDRSKQDLQDLLGNIEKAQAEIDHHHRHSHHHHHHHEHHQSESRHSSKNQGSAAVHQVNAAAQIKHPVSDSSSANESSAIKKKPVKKSDNSFAKRHRKMRRSRKILLTVFIVVFLLIVGSAGTMFWMIRNGAVQLQKKGGSEGPVLSADVLDMEFLDDNTIQYNEKKYQYNDDILNFLLVGLDTTGEIKTIDTLANGSGQSDVIVIAAVDLRNKKFTLIPINRDSMVELETYNKEKDFTGNKVAQITLSFAYGDGKEFSCELTRRAVSNLFYGLPIHGYCMVNLDAIPIINDMVGGVTVTLPEDLSSALGPEFTKGATVTLTGDKAESFIRTRAGIGDQTNASRMNQQKLYMTALAKQILKTTRENLTFPVEIYNVVSRYMLTDLGPSEVAYLATQAVGCEIPDDFFRSIPGESTVEEGYTAFYIDEPSLYELILNVFYSEV